MCILKMTRDMKVLSKVLAIAVGAIVLVGAGVMTACQQSYGEPTQQTFTLGDYTILDASSAFEVEMSEGITVPTLIVDELLMDKVVFKVEGDKLIIDLPGLVGGRIKSLKAQLPLNPELRKIAASGACDIEVLGETKLNELRLSGASKADINSATDMTTISLSGASKANIIGLGDVVSIDISGASNLDAEDLLVSEVNGTVSGASHADVTICSRLAVAVSGASNLTYGLVGKSCTPEIDCAVTGGSSVNAR